MKLRPGFLLTSIAAVLAAGCATSTGPEPMKLCSEVARDGRAAEELPASRKQVRTALVKAQEYSNLIYGADCLVCAEILQSERGNIYLHITSPAKGSEVNTSAGIEVQARDGKVLRKTQWHSCHARRGPD